MAGVWALMSALMLMAACAGIGGAPNSTTTATTSSVTTNTGGTIGATTTTTGFGCGDQRGFVDRAMVLRADQTSSDTGRLGLISWQASGDCERFTLRFETTEGAPATTPPIVQVDFIETGQVLRVRTDAESTVVTDQLVETELVDRLYVVRSLDGGLFIDFHLAAPARARAAVSNSPAQLDVELEPNGNPFASTAVVGTNAVILVPAGGAELPAGPTRVAGYSRVAGADVLVVARSGGRVVAETTTVAADSVTTWGEFTTIVELPPGQVSLFVGEAGPEDGSTIGATVNLTVR